jgi:hypothetical protein
LESPGNPTCIDTFCNQDGTLTLKDSDNVAICSVAGESVTLGSRTIICSNPVHICGIIEHDQFWSTENILGLVSPKTSDEDLSQLNVKNIIIIIVVLVVVLIIITIAVIFLIRWCRKKKKESDVQSNETLETNP